MIELIGSASMFLVIMLFAIAIQHRSGHKVDKVAKQVAEAGKEVVEKLKGNSGSFKPPGGVSA